jgi:putative FmdB family regulatory protein
MPFYEYECDNCKFYVEVMQKMSDAPLKKCPSCGKSALKKLVSAPNFRLKGSGWYETDFKSDQEKKRNLAVEKEDAGASSESKPAETPAASESKPAESKPAVSSKPAAVTTKPAAAAKRSGGGGRSAAPAKKAPPRPAARAKSKIAPKKKAKGRR